MIFGNIFGQLKNYVIFGDIQVFDFKERKKANNAAIYAQEKLANQPLPRGGKVIEHYQAHKCLIPPNLNSRWERYRRYLRGRVNPGEMSPFGTVPMPGMGPV